MAGQRDYHVWSSAIFDMRNLYTSSLRLVLLLSALIVSSCDPGSNEITASDATVQAIVDTPTTTLIAELTEPTATLASIETPTALPTKTPTSLPTLPATETTVPPTQTATPTPLAISVTSAAFESGNFIPERNARSGDNLSLPLTWSDPPEATKSYVILFVSDPVADGGGTWILWALYNIPADLRGLSEGLVPDEAGSLATGGQHLENSYMELAYSGPSPHPIETRRFYLRLYALDTVLGAADIEEAAAAVDTWIGGTEQTLLNAMEGHILARGQITGKYKGESPAG
jgi:Raf kinase inhibitor-like YbhB/YbcL family protein